MNLRSRAVPAARPASLAGGARSRVAALRQVRMPQALERSESVYAPSTSTRPPSMHAQTKLGIVDLCLSKQSSRSLVCSVAGIERQSQLHQRANPSIKRTGLRPAAYVQR